MKQELVKDWMTKDVVTTSPSTPLAVAHSTMKERGIRRMPVLDEDKLVGIITLTEIHEAEPAEINSLSIWHLHGLLSHLYVRGEMTRDPITVRATDTLGEAANLMLNNNISGLPVIDDAGKVVGIITESDIFRAVVKQSWNA